MPLPKRRHSHTRGAKRRTHWVLKAPELSACPQCAGLRKPHHVCLQCGFYDGREVVTPKTTR
ncbi:MAG: 50S ribosomal protein L32 [candidate division Zixibacteria bacterium]|nr:50S ribosomal protein L32 [candidate division Zixibacteria bacterium]